MSGSRDKGGGSDTDRISPHILADAYQVSSPSVVNKFKDLLVNINHSYNQTSGSMLLREAIANQTIMVSSSTTSTTTSLFDDEGVDYSMSNNSEFARKINDYLYSNQFYFIIGVTWMFLVFLSVFGNGLVILNALIFKKLNDLTNCYIFNLAITDMLFSIFCIPFTTYIYIFDDWLFGTHLKAYQNLIKASVQSTCLTLTAMTIHRCNLIVNNKTITVNAAIINKRQRHVLYITIGIWIASFLLASPDLIYFTVVEKSQGNETYRLCSLDENVYFILKYYINISNFVSIVTTYGLPLTIIISSYAKLISHLSRNQNRLARFNKKQGSSKKQNGKSKNENENEYVKLNQLNNLKSDVKVDQKQKNVSKPKNVNKKRRVTRMVVLVTINFAVCWFPTHLFIIINRCANIDQSSDAYIYLSVFKIVAHTLSYLTPVINPCLYAFFNENFRSSFYDLWLKLTCRYKYSPSNNFK